MPFFVVPYKTTKLCNLLQFKWAFPEFAYCTVVVFPQHARVGSDSKKHHPTNNLSNPYGLVAGCSAEPSGDGGILNPG